MEAGSPLRDLEQVTGCRGELETVGDCTEDEEEPTSRVTIEKEGMELNMTEMESFPTAERSRWEHRGHVEETPIAPAGTEGLPQCFNFPLFHPFMQTYFGPSTLYMLVGGSLYVER